MDTKQFVACWKAEKDCLVEAFTKPTSSTQVATAIAELKLSLEQTQQLRTILDIALTDAFYTLLLGLDGAASIGGIQQQYSIRDENGMIVATPGALEQAAYEAFHGKHEP